jgi:division protein CdvB (Snf7/Vps24/ESCRT-III family)
VLQQAASRMRDLHTISRLLERRSTHFQIRSTQLVPLSSERTLTPSPTQISTVMDKFETQFADLDVQTSYMEQTMSQSTAQTTPQDQVDALINQVADEAGLERQHELGSKGKVPEVQVEEKEAERPVGEEDARLAERLRALRVSSAVGFGGCR